MSLEQAINNLNSQYAVRPEPGNLQQFIRHSESLKHARTQFAAISLTRSPSLTRARELSSQGMAKLCTKIQLRRNSTRWRT